MICKWCLQGQTFHLGTPADGGRLMLLAEVAKTLRQTDQVEARTRQELQSYLTPAS